jgi:hypothetical protein
MVPRVAGHESAFRSVFRVRHKKWYYEANRANYLPKNGDYRSPRFLSANAVKPPFNSIIVEATI